METETVESLVQIEQAVEVVIDHGIRIEDIDLENIIIVTGKCA